MKTILTSVLFLVCFSVMAAPVPPKTAKSGKTTAGKKGRVEFIGLWKVRSGWSGVMQFGSDGTYFHDHAPGETYMGRWEWDGKKLTVVDYQVDVLGRRIAPVKTWTTILIPNSDGVRGCGGEAEGGYTQTWSIVPVLYGEKREVID